MVTSASESVVTAWARLLRAQRRALTAIEAALRAARLPPLGWYDVLLELERAGEQGLRPFELERQMLLEQYNLSRLLARIEAAGYLERRACRDDRRGQLILITAAGKELRRRMWAVYGPAIQGAIGARLSAGQAATLARLLGRLSGEGAGAESGAAP